MLTTYALSFLGLYALALVGVSLQAARAQSDDAYVLGRRDIGLFATVSSVLAGQFNGGGVFLVFTWAMTIGYGALWSTVGIAAGYLMIALVAKRVHAEAQTHGYVNLPDMVAHHFGPRSAGVTSGVIMGKALIFSCAQLLIAGKVVGLLFGVPGALGIVGVAAAVAAYLWVGGYLTVIRTDLFQWAFLLILVALPVLFVGPPRPGLVVGELVATPFSEFWGTMAFSAALTASNADSWQRLYSARTAQVGRTSLLLVGPIFSGFIFAGLVGAKSLSASAGGPLSFFELFAQSGVSAAALAALGVFVITAVMSTVDTQAYLFSSALAKTLLRIDLAQEQARYVRVSRWSTVGLMVVLSAVAITVGSTLEFIFKAFSLAFVLAPVALFAAAGGGASKERDQVGVLALLVGISVYLWMFFATGLFQFIGNTLIPTGCTALVLALGGVWSRVRTG